MKTFIKIIVCISSIAFLAAAACEAIRRHRTRRDGPWREDFQV